MVQKDTEKGECRLRIDPVLVDKFRRLPAGINEVGTKIVRDFGLRYQYDKKRGTLEIIGPDTEILAIAVETLRFWVEDDEFPDTGITCQVGYPNRCNAIWRFHGDYAKKFDHLFAAEIARLKLFTSVNIKAVPNKRNPEYVELYCHFSVYHQVKTEVSRISRELAKIFQNDFFIPKSDFKKARDFARSKMSDDKVLYALKEYPDNKVRVWLFARDQMDVIRAKREWVLHVGIIARDNEFTETINQDNSIKSASFYGHPASELGSDFSGPVLPKPRIRGTKRSRAQKHSEVKQVTQTSLNLSQSKLNIKSQKSISNNDVSPRGPRFDNSNFPRPHDFVYPIHKDSLDDNDQETYDQEYAPVNPFEAGAEILDAITEDGALDASNSSTGGARWVPEGETNLYRARKLSQPYQNRIYVHHQIDDQQLPNKQNQQASKSDRNDYASYKAGTQVVHPEKNLIEKERFNPTHQSVLTSVTDPNQAPAIKKGNRGARPGLKATKQSKVNANTRQKRPVLRVQKQPNIRYNININGLDIFMYKHDITKLDNMDALANVVAPSLKEGDLTAETMFAMAGKKVSDELDVNLRLHGEAQMAENVVTSAGKLPALGIIHVVSPIWQRYTVWQDCASDLHKAIYNTLKTAEKHKYRKIAIPTIGSEPYFGIPKDLVAEVYVKALMDYSMGMGPMYPVLEIHLVDNDHNMLTYIKDAYESWAATPGVADMTQHIRKESENIIKDPKEVSARSQSAVSLKSMPSHRSENMVTFTGQSYTKEGEQKWTFDILKKLVVHVYTGSILKLDEAEAIVCAVDVNMKGTLAKQVEIVAGKRYKASLKGARGNRTLVEGEVLVCDAGELRMRKVLHSVISAPIHVINQKNLSRLDSINTQVLYTASQHGIRILAMPLIGTGRLRERLEVEQCSLQLIDNIIELCLSLGKGMKLKELHLVNTNHVMTQYLTQALRTRAHTKLRVETESHVPSRQEVLTKAEAIRSTPEKFETLSVKSARSNASSTKSTQMKPKINDNSSQIHEENQPPDPKPENLQVEDIRDVDENRETNGKAVKNNLGNKTEHSEFHKITDVTKNRKKKNGKAPYLSMKNLETHDRIIRDAWMHLMDDEMEGIDYKKPNGLKKPEQPKRHKELAPLEKDVLVKKAQEFLNRKKIKKTKPPPKKRHRIVQHSSDFVFQRSRAESYKTIYEKKQKYVEKVNMQEQNKLRKTQSSDDIWKKQIADEVLETFKEEREKLSLQKRQSLGENENLADDEKIERELLLNTGRKYYTRDTKDRYKKTATTSEDSTNDRFENFNRVNVNEADADNISIWNDKQSITHMSEKQRHFQKLKKIRSERHLIDKEREDQYMMDMDFLAKEREELERHKEENTTAKDNVAVDVYANHLQKGELDLKSKQEQYTASTSPERTYNPQTELGGTIPLKRHSTPVDQYLHQQQNIPRNDSGITPGNEMSYEKEFLDDSINDTDIRQPATPVSAPETQKDIDDKASIPGMVEHSQYPATERVQNKSHVLKTGKQSKTYIGSISRKGDNSQPSNAKTRRSGRQAVARVKFKDDDRLTEEYEIPGIPRAAASQHGGKMTKKDLELFNERRRYAIAMKARRSEEVKIRDNIKLQVNVIEKDIVDPVIIEKEKKKIRRFWEVVAKDSAKDEKDMFGDIDNKDKMLVTKVTKERVMSAKTKESKQSKGTAVTHNVGEYNVTVAVEN